MRFYWLTFIFLTASLSLASSKHIKPAAFQQNNESVVAFTKDVVSVRPLSDKTPDFEKLIRQRHPPQLKILIQEPSSAEKYLKQGVDYGDQGQYEQAVESFRHAISLDPDSVFAHYNLGWAYSQLGRYKEAIASCQQAIKLDAGLVDAYFTLGVAYNALGDTV
jgi:tetratricopeptide (TPR) repeat protein